MPEIDNNHIHAFHLFVIQSEKRNELYDFLKSNNIYSQVHYILVSNQPYYIERYGNKNFPVAENYYRKALSLPMYHSLTTADQDKVIGAVRQFYGR